ncbi:hypothetical protein PIROE2DRAFT_13175 [Piromyces sp. E2]|nr:hypothetical protein PIROE2DRAFT_13175 [Piromyces sp. E2]|eukprot:OUM60926.1 hypothetical protein PIROE2DRAFT_13175 [Piromyces sp. E2]
MIFITVYRKQKIIADVGYFKNTFLLTGLLIYSTNFYFNSFSGYTQCHRLGLRYDELDYLKLDIFQNDEDPFLNNINNVNINDSLKTSYIENNNNSNNNNNNNIDISEKPDNSWDEINNYDDNGFNSNQNSFSETIMNDIEHKLNKFNNDYNNKKDIFQNIIKSKSTFNSAMKSDFENTVFKERSKIPSK